MFNNDLKHYDNEASCGVDIPVLWRRGTKCAEVPDRHPLFDDVAEKNMAARVR